MEKSNIVPLHKKSAKQLVRNYVPVSFLPIRGKILEILIFNKMFQLFIQSKLIRENHKTHEIAIMVTS